MRPVGSSAAIFFFRSSTVLPVMAVIWEVNSRVLSMTMVNSSSTGASAAAAGAAAAPAASSGAAKLHVQGMHRGMKAKAVLFFWKGGLKHGLICGFTTMLLQTCRLSAGSSASLLESSIMVTRLAVVVDAVDAAALVWSSASSSRTGIAASASALTGRRVRSRQRRERLVRSGFRSGSRAQVAACCSGASSCTCAALSSPAPAAGGAPARCWPQASCCSRCGSEATPSMPRPTSSSRDRCSSLNSEGPPSSPGSVCCRSNSSTVSPSSTGSSGIPCCPADFRRPVCTRLARAPPGLEPPASVPPEAAEAAAWAAVRASARRSRALAACSLSFSSRLSSCHGPLPQAPSAPSSGAAWWCTEPREILGVRSIMAELKRRAA
mmetsp:Transcript_50709/g.147167  ORF Transcript_50709/g.147167 Transcript_50709/m.147167 type:complete len:379 (+) Transcript_50709:2562-3698(+)